ncbi:hypothetical protein BGZ95_003543, partial [Linnemannia exigua]
LEGLEGADLRHLGSFLKASDEGKVLGNLYRTVTPKGHVKWVCLDHYRESYGAAALQEFKEMVELSGGKYDQRTGRVTMRLASPILAKQFYTMLLSCRLVHELELSLDWNTSFEDLRILKGVMQQSNVFHLGLNLCGKTGPTSDFVYRNRRAEPIIQIMASGKIHTMHLKNTIGFLSQSKELLKSTLHVRHFDLGERVGNADDFVKLEKLIRASPMLIRLGVVVGDMDGAFTRLKPFVARHKTLSILDLQLQDGTAASVQFEQGSEKISTIGLKVVEPSAIRLMRMPMVTSVTFLVKNTQFRSSGLVKSAIEEHAVLKVIEVVCLPDGVVEELQELQRALDGYTTESQAMVLDDREFFMEEKVSTVAAMSTEDTAIGTGFAALHSIHRRSYFGEMTLLIVSVDEAAGVNPVDTATAPVTVDNKPRSTIIARRAAGSLATVRFEFADNLDLYERHPSVQELPSLQNLLQVASTLSRLKVSVSSLHQAFMIVNDAALLHKQLSQVLLIMGKSRLLAQFTVGGGVIESIALCSRENELNQFLTHPKVTELDLGLIKELPRIQEVATLVFNHYRHLKTFKMDYRFGHLLQVIAMLSHAAGAEISEGCCLVLGEVDVDFPRRKERVFNLPLMTLNIASYEIDEEDVDVVERLFRSHSGLQELYISVSSVDVAQQIFDCIVQECRPMTTLSMSLSDDAMAVFSLEVEEEGGALTAIQKITQSELDATFFLPLAELQRVDVLGEHIEKAHFPEIAAIVLRDCSGVGSIRFVDFPDELDDIAIVIKNSIQRGLFLQDIERQMSLTDGTDEWQLTTASTKGAELAVYSVHSNDIQDKPLLRGVEEKSVESSIVRALQNGTVEAIELDCTDPDGVTLRVNAVAFEKSIFAQHPYVTRLTVVIRHGSTLTGDLVSTPIITFKDLQQLEISCLFSLDLNALLAVFEVAPNHPALKQIQIWCPDQSSNRITFDLPIKTLDLSWYSLLPTEHQLLQRIAAINPLLTDLTVKVSALFPVFEAVSSSVKSLGALEQLYLQGEEGSVLSIRFNPVTSDMVSVMLSSVEIQDSILSWDVPMLRMMEFTDTTLDLIEVIQAATVNNPGLQSLVLKDWMSDPRITLEIPFRKIDLGKRAIPLVRVRSLKRLLLACPWLTEICLPLDSVADLHEAVKIFGPVFQKYKKLTDVRLTLQNGTEASVRYSGEDGSVTSIALRVLPEFAVTMRSLPMVKKITIRPRDTSTWRNESDINMELAKILTIYNSLETLEFDCGITSPFTALLFLQRIVTKQSPIRASPHLRRYRHRTYDSSPVLITHDLPLVKLDLGDYFVSVETFSALSDLALACPKLADLRMFFPTSEVIDPVYARLSNEMAAFGKLTKLTLKSRDGYGIALHWMGLMFQDSLRITQGRVVSRQNIERVELQVSGTEWPSCFERPRASVSKLMILPKAIDGSSAVTDNSDSIGDILSLAAWKCQDIKHIVLTCPVHRFYELSSKALSTISTVNKIDLHDPADVTKKILTENLVDEIFMSTFQGFFAEHHLSVDIIDWRQPVEDGAGEWLEVKVGMSRMDGVADSEVARLLTKLLVGKATEVDIEYEAMVALIPFIKAEIQRRHATGTEWRYKPFELLRRYDIRTVREPVKDEDVKAFGALIPRAV